MILNLSIYFGGVHIVFSGFKPIEQITLNTVYLFLERKFHLADTQLKKHLLINCGVLDLCKFNGLIYG